MKVVLTVLLILIALPAFADDKSQQVVREKCERLMIAFDAIEIKASQTELVSQVKREVVANCNKLIEAEKPAPKVEAKAEGDKQ